MKKWNSLLEGAIELHSHSSPSIFPRKQNDWELLEDVKNSRMAGIVLKAHEGSSCDRALLLKDKFPDVQVFGGHVCNYYTGGLNPYGVELALKLGAKIIWMPTLSSSQHLKYFSKNAMSNILNPDHDMCKFDEGIRISTNKEVKDEVKTILHLIAEHNAILATGHLGAEEVFMLVKEAKIIGVKNILIQHVDLGISPFTIEQQKQLVDLGCILEKCYLACSNDFKDLTIQEMATSIKILGAKNCVLVTDYGQSHNIGVVDALSNFVEDLLKENISEDSIRSMIVENPRLLLDLV